MGSILSVGPIDLLSRSDSSWLGSTEHTLLRSCDTHHALRDAVVHNPVAVMLIADVHTLPAFAATVEAFRVVAPKAKIIGCAGFSSQALQETGVQDLVDGWITGGHTASSPDEDGESHTIRRIMAQIDQRQSSTSIGVVRNLRSGRVSLTNPFADRFFDLNQTQLSGNDVRDLLGAAGYTVLGAKDLLNFFHGGRLDLHPLLDAMGIAFRIPIPPPVSGHVWLFCRARGLNTQETKVLEVLLESFAGYVSPEKSAEFTATQGSA